jgi:ParB family chromosome partitioning protein
MAHGEAPHGAGGTDAGRGIRSGQERAPDNTIAAPAPARLPEVNFFDIDDIVVGDRLRELDLARVEDLKTSIAAIGLQTPITIRLVAETVGATICWIPVLVAGLHRLRACQALGLGRITAIVADETDARLWEISENLHRAELTVLERGEHIAEWVKLTEERREQQPAQLAPPVRKHGHAQEGGGINAAVRDLGIDRTEAQRAVKIAALAPEAQETARDLHLDDNQAALLKAAKAPTAEAQVEVLQAHAAAKA